MMFPDLLPAFHKYYLPAKLNSGFIEGKMYLAGGIRNEADAKLAASLRKALGTVYKVHYPEMPTDEEPYFGSGWVKQIGEDISSVTGEVILAGG